MAPNKTPSYLEKVKKMVADRKVLSAEIHSLWGQIVKLRDKRATLSTNIKALFTELKAYHASRRTERVAELEAAKAARKAKAVAVRAAAQAERAAKKAARQAKAVAPAAVPAA